MVVAVRRRLRDLAGRHGAGCARPVLDHDRLAEQLRHARRQDARNDVGAAARREADHHPNRFAGIVLRMDDTAEKREEQQSFSHRMH